MTLAVPRLALEGDPDGAMAAHPELLGVSRARAVWRFGFRRGTALSRAFAVWLEVPVWALVVHSGGVLDLYAGPWDAALPDRFANVIRMKL